MMKQTALIFPDKQVNNMQNIIKKTIKFSLEKLGYEIWHKSVMPGTGSMERIINNMKKKGLCCSSILDIGANRCQWSREIKSIFPYAKFYLIEPQLEMQKALDKFCLDYPDSSYFLVGAGSDCGEATLTVWPGELKEASTFTIPEYPGLTYQSENFHAEQRRLPIVTIDSLLAQQKISLPELVKLDVEGFELEVLKGASKLFGYVEAFVLEVILLPTEANPPMFHEVIQFMAERNYVLYDFPGFGHRNSDRSLALMNIVFVKKDSFLRM